MAEGLALAASIFAVLQITNSVINVCYDYSAAAKDAPWELSQVRAEMESLRDVLQRLQPLAKQAEVASSTAGTRLPTLQLLCGSQGLLQYCLNEVTRLDENLKTPSWSDGFGPKRKAIIQALRWPLNRSETMKALENIGRYKSTLTLAITADEATLIMAIQKLSLSVNDIVLGTQGDVCSIKGIALDMHRDLQSTKNVTLDIHQGMERERIYKWLSAPDPSTNHNRASRSRQADTGLWFLESEMFTHWKEQEQNSLLWLHGKAGCGKTVLSSTIINEVLQEPQFKNGMAVAYFYFDFNDVEKQKSDKMIQSLITQLSGQSTKKLNKLESLFSSCNNGDRQPEVERLMPVLKEAVEAFDETYIILDALDECSDKESLLDIVDQLHGWNLRHLHMLITSRRLIDIEESLEPLIDPRSKICIDSALVNADIKTYVRARLQTDRHLKRWDKKPSVQEEIETTLMQKADGMFRWAVCQLDVLRTCFNLPMLRTALKSLPKTLDETYARMLCKIPEEHSDYAIKVLQWLAYSARPLRLEELAEIFAVNVDGSPWFDCDGRFDEQQDILALCSSLVTTEEVIIDVPYSPEKKSYQAVRLAHFSVKEYLVSERIRDQAAATARYAIQEIEAHQFIAAACLAYLLQFDQHDSLTSKTIEDFPLAPYAAEYWMQHTRVVGKNLDPIRMLILELCLVRREAYVNWYRFYDPDLGRVRFDLNREIAEIANPLYYGSLNEVTELIRLLLKEGADVNAKGGHYGNALQAASCEGHEAVVQLLLKEGADVHAKGGKYDNALQAASYSGSEAVVQLLLKEGADVHAKGGDFGNALQAASSSGSEAVVQLLLKEGADVNAKGEQFGNALQAASYRGSEAVVQLLLKEGADVNAKGGYYDTALQAASAEGHEAVVQLLLKEGADVNAKGGQFGNALQAASFGGSEAVVQLLLKEGADVNAKGGYYGNALQAASCKGSEAVVQLLLKEGADVHAKGGEFGNALHAASCRGSEAVVQLLLKEGADVHVKGGKYGTALQAALKGETEPWASGHKSSFKAVIQLLESAMESQPPPASPPITEEPTQLT